MLGPRVRLLLRMNNCGGTQTFVPRIVVSAEAHNHLKCGDQGSMEDLVTDRAYHGSGPSQKRGRKIVGIRRSGKA